MKLCYTTMLVDRHSKAFYAVPTRQMYGEGINITKNDCINQVSKRMGTALRNLMANSKAQKESIDRRGKMTQEKILKMTNYYGRAIKRHLK